MSGDVRRMLTAAAVHRLSLRWWRWPLVWIFGKRRVVTVTAPDGRVADVVVKRYRGIDYLWRAGDE